MQVRCLFSSLPTEKKLSTCFESVEIQYDLNAPERGFLNNNRNGQQF